MSKSFTDIFIKRPVLSAVVSTLIFLFGMKCLADLPIRQYPELTTTVITITTVYPGAAAELMKGFITTPVQQAVASAEGVEYITSTSRESVSTVNAYIRNNFSPNAAMTEVISKVQQVNRILPKDANPPVVTKTTGSSIAALYIGFESTELPTNELTDFIKRQIQPRIVTLEGVGSADILGGQTLAMRLWLDPARMKARNISKDDVLNAITRNNYQSAAGQTKGYFVLSPVEANTGLKSSKEFEQLVVKTIGKKIIRLHEVADIELDSESYDSIVKMNAKQSVFIGVANSPTANPLTMVKTVRTALDNLKADLPASLHFEYAYDATEFIQASIHEVIITLLEASLIVIVVIFLFLGSFRAVFIPLITIPLSLVGVASAMHLLGFSLNLLTLLAMVIAIGLVVDDAIVVLENVYRHLQAGEPPLKAAQKGAQEIAIPVITMTLTLVAVYAPIGFMQGVTGSLFREFALTLAGSVVVSGIVALTLSPMMCSLLLNRKTLESNYSKKLETGFTRLSNYYQKLLDKTLHDKKSVLLVFGTVLISGGLFLMFIPKELAPAEDQGIVLISTKAPNYANIDYMAHYSNDMVDKLLSLPERSLVFSFAGMGTPQSGFGGFILKPWHQRERSSHILQNEIQQKISTIPGISAFAFEPPPLPGPNDGLPVQFVVNSLSDYKQIYNVVEELKGAAYQSGLFMIADSDLNFSTPSTKITIDHDKANTLGITMGDIGDTLALMLGGNYLGLFDLDGRSYQVIPQVGRKDRLTPLHLEQFYVTTASGKQVALANIASIQISSEANQLFQFNQMNSATFQAIPWPWVKMGQVVQFLKNYAKTSFPEGFTYDFMGESRQFVQEGNSLYITFVFAIVVIFLVLAAQFESLRDPIIIMLSVPLSMFGAILILFLGASTLNIYSEIGLITLIGLITKHGILIVEFANQLQIEQQLLPRAAIIQAAATRLRPILMTTSAMVVGLIPLMGAQGAGSASRHSIGVVIVSGMLIGTLFTLFVVPTFYLLLSKPKI